MIEINIRTATRADAESIASISRETFFDTYAADNTKENMDKFLTQQFTHEMLVEEVGKEENHFFLATVGNTIAGYIKIKASIHPQLNSANALEISRLYVRKPFIGKSVGRALMLAAIEFARQQQKEWLWLIVWKQNQPALKFYQSFGYEIFAESIFILGDDPQNDWVMKLRIQ